VKFFAAIFSWLAFTIRALLFTRVEKVSLNTYTDSLYSVVFRLLRCNLLPLAFSVQTYNFHYTGTLSLQSNTFSLYEYTFHYTSSLFHYRRPASLCIQVDYTRTILLITSTNVHCTSTFSTVQVFVFTIHVAVFTIPQTFFALFAAIPSGNIFNLNSFGQVNGVPALIRFCPGQVNLLPLTMDG